MKSEGNRNFALISYHPDDRTWVERLVVHLEPLLRRTGLSHWSDMQLHAGEDRAVQLNNALRRARALVLLVSADYLASPEFDSMIAAAREFAATLLWLPVRSSAYEATELRSLQPLVEPERALSRLPPAEAEAALVIACLRITEVLSAPRRVIGAEQQPPPALKAEVGTTLDGKSAPTPEPPANAAPLTAVTASPGLVLELAAPQVRRLLGQLLRAKSELDAFLIDHFPQVWRHVAAGMDRVAKINLLFEHVDWGVLLTAIRTAFPHAFAYVLVVDSPSEPRRLYPLPTDGSIMIGRAIDADVRIAEFDKTVSRRHALIEATERGVVVHKQGKLPIYVNGQEITASTRLQPDDTLRIHESTLHIQPFSAIAWEPTFVSYREETPEDEVAMQQARAEQRAEASRPKRPARKAAPMNPDSAHELLWGLADKLLKLNRVREAERMMARRLLAMRAQAEDGEVPDERMVAETLHRALRLAIATQKNVWLRWVFDYARVCQHKIQGPLLEELFVYISVCQPAISTNISAYATTVSDEKIIARLKALQSLCSDS